MVRTYEVQNDSVISDKNYLCDKISSVFEDLNSQRQPQKNDIKAVENAIFMKEPDKFQMTDLFELYQTFLRVFPVAILVHIEPDIPFGNSLDVRPDLHKIALLIKAIPMVDINGNVVP